MLRLLAITALAGFSALAQPPIPDTPAGRVLRAWLEAFNSGDKTKIEAYLRVHDPGKAPDRMADLREQTGGFELLGIDSSERSSIEFRVKEVASPTEAAGSIEVNDSDPPTVKHFSLRVRAPGEAAGAAS